MRRSIALRRVVLALALVAAALALAELAVRRFLPQPAFFAEPGLYVGDAAIGYRLRPGVRAVVGNVAEFRTAVHVDAAGLRGSELGPKRAGVERVLVLGDSLTFGPGVTDDAAYPALLGRDLTARGVPAEGLNAGIGGYGVPDEVAWFGRYGLPLAPDVVVLGIFTGNDLQDAMPGRPPLRVVDGDLLDPSDLRRSATFHWLFQHSQLVALAKYSLPPGIDRRLRGMLRLPAAGAARALRSEMETYERRPRPSTLAGAAASEAAIRRLVALANAHGMAVAALLLPSYLQSDDRAWSAALAELGVDSARYDRAMPNHLFAAALARCGVPTLDLMPELARAASGGEVPFFPRDHHYTASGHRRIAERAAAFLLPMWSTGGASPPPPRG